MPLSKFINLLESNPPNLRECILPYNNIICGRIFRGRNITEELEHIHGQMSYIRGSKIEELVKKIPLEIQKNISVRFNELNKLEEFAHLICENAQNYQVQNDAEINSILLRIKMKKQAVNTNSVFRELTNINFSSIKSTFDRIEKISPVLSTVSPERIAASVLPEGKIITATEVMRKLIISQQAWNALKFDTTGVWEKVEGGEIMRGYLDKYVTVDVRRWVMEDGVKENQQTRVTYACCNKLSDEQIKEWTGILVLVNYSNIVYE